MSRLTRLIVGTGALAVALPATIWAESGFEGRYGFAVEFERKKCTSCTPTEYDNEIEVSILDLVLKPKSRPDLSFGLQLEFDTESEGAILGSGRMDVVNNTGLGLWVRKDFDNGLWARVQATTETEEGLLDLGGRIGYTFEINKNIELSSYAHLERRFPIGSSTSADKGTYVEAGLELNWDWDNHGAWVEFQASQWFFDSGAVADEREFVFQPGLWFELGETDHRGLLWFEFGHFEATGARQEQEYSTELGVGLEFELTKRSELMVGLTIGREREKQPGRPDEHATVYGLEVAFQRSF